MTLAAGFRPLWTNQTADQDKQREIINPGLEWRT